MPGKIKVTKEMIIDCAIKITRCDGADAVNARRIGKELNCSLQPVYYYFGTMDSLREEIIMKANSIYNGYIEESKKMEPPRFKNVGMQYLRFATEEKELFKLLFMRNAKYRSDFTVEVDDNAEYIINEIMSTYGLSAADAKKIHFESWVATHGLASMLATEYMDFDKEQISDYLTDIFGGLICRIKETNK